MIKAVLFDLDGTLIDHESAVAAAVADFGLRHLPETPPTVLHSAWQSAAARHFPRFVTGEISFQEQLRRRIKEVLGRPDLGEAEADAFYRSYLGAYEPLCAPFPDAPACLSAFAGRAMGIVSNGETRQQWGKLRRSGLLPHFGTVIISEEAGLRKPDPRVFELAASNLGVTPGECAFVGDDPEADYRGSEAAGLFPILLDRRGKASGGKLRAVASLSEVPSLIRSQLSDPGR